MEAPLGRILKGSNVELEGRLHLEAPQAGARSPQKSHAAAEPGVHIVKKHPDFALIEVTCSCGEKMYLRCEYAGVKTYPGQSPAQNATPEAVEMANNQPQ